MTGRFDTAYHEERQGRVRAVLIAAEAWLRPEDVAQADEFLDANEYGIALEFIADALVEADVPVERGVYEDIRTLAADMDLSEGLAPSLTTLDTRSCDSDYPP